MKLRGFSAPIDDMPAAAELGGRYRLLRELGSGGMAVVHLAHDRVLDRRVAIKLLRAQFAQDETFVARFRQEARAAAGFTHPNLVSVYDVGQEGTVQYIVMEYVEGESLKQLLTRRGPLPAGHALALGMASALQERGPAAAANLLLNSSGAIFAA